MTKRLPYLQRFRDRHGKVRHYFRRAGHKPVALPGRFGSEEFMLAYHAALQGETAPRREVGAERTIRGSVSALVVSYYGSAEFKTLSASTKVTYRGILDRFRAEKGEKPVAMMEPRHVRQFIAAKAETPAAANNLLRMLRLLMRHAVEEGWRQDDPTYGVRPIRSKSQGFHTWTEDEISTFIEAHAQGTRARLAFDLLLFTGQRRSDVIRMGWQHVRGGALHVRQQKTGIELAIPLHADLRGGLEHAPKGNMTFLLTAQGAPFTAAGFGNWFREVVSAAGLSDECSAHGLRKAAARRLAEAGCSAHEIASITGHRTLKEVERYTRAADQTRLAASAMKRMGEAGGDGS